MTQDQASTVKFVTAESAAESEPLFRSMSHDELVRNCLAAQELIGLQIARAEYHKERADRVTKLGKEIDVVCRKYLGLFERIQRQMASTMKEFAGRDQRKDRAEIYAGILTAVRETLAAAPPAISWPIEDLHSVTRTKPEHG